jgi:hypothetical protein
MTQIIIYKNPDASNVVVCRPTGLLPIEEVLVKDCPEGAIIVDESTLPTGDDASFFDAWVLNENTVSIDLDKAKADYLKSFNEAVLKQAQTRQLNSMAGIENLTDDATWLSEVTKCRNTIQNAKNTTEVLQVDAIPK